MRIDRWGGLLVLLLIFQTCVNKKEELPQEKPEPPKFRMESFKKQTQPCREETNYCAKVSAVYPVLESGISPGILKAVNDSVLYFVKNSLTILEPGSELSRYSLSAIADSFFYAYTTYGQEIEFPVIWELETTGEVLFISQSLMSVALENYGYTGGAHPNSHTMLLNFDLKTGRSLDIRDMVRNMMELKRLAEKAFRESRDLSPDEDLNEAGFFGDNGFQLPANFGITPEGLYFFYNSYEIASYATGPTDFVLTWEELGDLVARDWME